MLFAISIIANTSTEHTFIAIALFYTEDIIYCVAVVHHLDSDCAVHPPSTNHCRLLCHHHPHHLEQVQGHTASQEGHQLQDEQCQEVLI